MAALLQPGLDAPVVVVANVIVTPVGMVNQRRCALLTDGLTAHGRRIGKAQAATLQERKMLSRCRRNNAYKMSQTGREDGIE